MTAADHADEVVHRLDSPAVVFQHRRRGVALLAALPLAVLGLALAFKSPVPVLAGYALPGVIAWLVFEHFGPLRVGRAPGATILVTASGVSIVRASGKRRELPRERITEGWTESYAGDHRVVLRMRGGDRIAIRVPDGDAGQRLLAAAGLTADRRRWRALLVSRVAERFSHAQRDLMFFITAALGFIGFGAAVAVTSALVITGPLGQVIAAALWVVLLAAAGIALVGGLAPRSVTVGTDGVTVRAFGKTEFIAFKDVSQVRVDERGVHLVAKAGGERLLATSPNPGRSRISQHPGPEERALYERIIQAMSVGRLGTDADARFSVLDRRGRSIVQWRDDLRALGHGKAASGGYRVVPLEREELMQVVHDASAAAERRIGAALALGTDPDAFGPRLRIAVDTAANERLRVAIEKAATDDLDDEALEEAIRADTAASA